MSQQVARRLSSILPLLALVLLVWHGRGHGALNGGLLKLAQVTGLRGWEATVTNVGGLAQAQRLLAAAQEELPTARSARRNLGMALSLAGDAAAAQAEWQAVPGLAVEFARYGEIARRSGQMASAYLWFGRAWALEPTNGAYAVWQARAAEQMADWPAASAIYQAALAQPDLSDVGTGELLYRLGLIYQLRQAAPDLKAAQTAYTSALEVGGFESDVERADTWYHLGEIQQSQAEPLAAKASFEQAAAINPAHYWAQLRLAQLIYSLDGNVAQAVTRLQAALQAWPDEPSRRWPYQLLGGIYQQAGQVSAAIEAYETALRYDPANPDIPGILRALRRITPTPP